MSETYLIEVAVSDGSARATRTFNLTVKNSAPVLSAISDRTVTPGQTVAITLNATDADNDPLTFSVRVANYAYELKQQLGLSYAGSYYQNLLGANEKWMKGSSGVWYFILPNGEVHRWVAAGSNAATLKASNLVAAFDPRYYADPSLLWNAKPPSSLAPTFSLVGNQLLIQTSTAMSETYLIEVAVSDGSARATRTFNLTVRNN
jgi:hypothetical protein